MIYSRSDINLADWLRQRAVHDAPDNARFRLLRRTFIMQMASMSRVGGTLRLRVPGPLCALRVGLRTKLAALHGCCRDLVCHLAAGKRRVRDRAATTAPALNHRGSRRRRRRFGLHAAPPHLAGADGLALWIGLVAVREDDFCATLELAGEGGGCAGVHRARVEGGAERVAERVGLRGDSLREGSREIERDRQPLRLATAGFQYGTLARRVN